MTRNQTRNHKGQTAADLRAERIEEARKLALSILEYVEAGSIEPEPAGGWNWGHAGDWGAVVERLEDAHGSVLNHTVPGDSSDMAQTFLQIRSLLTGGIPTRVRTYPVVRNGRVIRVTVPESTR